MTKKGKQVIRVLKKKIVTKKTSMILPMGLPLKNDSEAAFNVGKFYNRTNITEEKVLDITKKSKSSLTLNRSTISASRDGSAKKTMLRTRTTKDIQGQGRW